MRSGTNVADVAGTAAGAVAGGAAGAIGAGLVMKVAAAGTAVLGGLIYTVIATFPIAVPLAGGVLGGVVTHKLLQRNRRY